MIDSRLALPVFLASTTFVALPWARTPVMGDPEPLPPNVLVILADDVGLDSMSTYRISPEAPPTPNINALAADGVVFRNAWCSPNCSPTRATLQTGRYGFRTGLGTIITDTFTNGYGLPLSEVTIPEMLDQGTLNAYAHGAFGKWHLGTLDVGGDLAPNMAGYAHFAGSMTNLNGADNYFSWVKVVDGIQEASTTYATTDTVDSTLAFLGTVQEPWMCSVNFHAGHTPFHEPPAALHSQDLTGETLTSNPRAFYKAMVEAMDTEIGRLFASIGPAVMDNTLVIFVGDNGTPGIVGAPPPYSTPGLKGSLYEGGINVPFIVSGPGVTWQGESSELIHTVDILPTIAAVAGVDLATEYPAVQIDGIDLSPHLADINVSTREFLFSERFAPNGPGNPIPAQPCPDPTMPFCQEDFGFAGPGNLLLTLCGEEHYGGTTAPLKLENCIPFAISFLIRSEVANQIPLYGGTVVPFPPTHLIVGTADANGEISRNVGNFSNPVVSYFQAASLDPAVPEGLAFSNVVKVSGLETHQRAARNERYKLIVNEPVCREEFYDLLADPSESTDLLAQGTLTGDALTGYLDLKSFLASL